MSRSEYLNFRLTLDRQRQIAMIGNQIGMEDTSKIIDYALSQALANMRSWHYCPVADDDIYLPIGKACPDCGKLSAGR